MALKNKNQRDIEGKEDSRKPPIGGIFMPY